MASRARLIDLRSECGQATILVLGVVGSLLVGLAVFGAFGQALGAKGRHQRAADLAAMSAARAMSRTYPRLFEPPYTENGLSNPLHLSTAAYVSLARRTAVRVARRNRVRLAAQDVTFPRDAFAPTLVTVTARGEAGIPVGGRPRRAAIPVRGRATAELTVAGAAAEMSAAGCPAVASGGGYDGPLAYRMGKPMRPDVAIAFDRHGRCRAPRGRPRPVGDERLSLRRRAGASVRSQPQSQVGGAAGHEPPPLRHRARPRPARRVRVAARRTRAASASSSSYAWEPWHFGYGANPRDRAHPAQYERGSWEPPGGDHGRIHHHLPSFVPAAVPRSDRPGRAALERADEPARRAALRGERTSTRSRRARPARRASPSSCPAPPAPTASAIPSTRSRRSTPRPT